MHAACWPGGAVPEVRQVRPGLATHKRSVALTSGCSTTVLGRWRPTWHFERGYSSLADKREWGDFLERCRKEPRKAFSLVADSQIVALLYRLP
jgi:hypothetical protein